MYREGVRAKFGLLSWYLSRYTEERNYEPVCKLSKPGPPEYERGPQYSVSPYYYLSVCTSVQPQIWTSTATGLF